MQLLSIVQNDTSRETCCELHSASIFDEQRCKQQPTDNNFEPCESLVLAQLAKPRPQS